MLIKELINLKSFDPVINLKWAGNINEQERLLANYIMTEDLAEIFVDILESITMVRSSTRRAKLQDINPSMKRAHILSGQYGTGKSYFLLMLSVVLEMKNSRLADELISRFNNFPELQYQLNLIRKDKKYFLVRINGENENEKDFKDVIQSEVTRALEEKFEDISLSSVYKETMENFDRVVRANRNKIEDFLLMKDYTIRDVEANLFHHKREGISQFEEIAKEVLGFLPKIELDKLEDFLKDANDVLKEQGYDELIIIFDEFSAYISASMENNRLHKDLGQIQNIAELTAKATNIDVSFIASTHTDIVQMIGKYDNSKKDMLDKVIGRFGGHVLSFNQGEELLKSTIEIKNKLEIEDLFYKYSNFVHEAEDKFNRKLMDFYPLHPATAAFLEPISNQYAQKTRTTFTFLEEVIRRKFYNEPVEKNGKINLITLSDLYDYFEKEIEQGNKNLVKEFNQIYNEVREDEDLINYAKALVLAYSNSLVKSNNKTEFTANDFAVLYQKSSEEEVERKLGQVASANHINIQKINGKYRMFVNTSGINIEMLLNKEKEIINPNFIRDKILEKAEDRIFIKKHYNLKYNMGLYPMDRELDGEKFTINNLKQMGKKIIIGKKPKELGADGKIFFVIPNFEEEYNQNDIIDDYKIAMNDLEANVCLAVPKEIVFNKEELIEYGALLNLENNNENIAKNEDIKKLVVQRRRKLEDKIRNKYLRKFSNLRNFTFIFSKGKIRDDLRQDIALYKELLYNFYSKFPHEIKVENFNTRSPLNGLIKIFLDGNADISKKDRTSEEAKNVYATLKPLDLISVTEKVEMESVEFKVPNENNSSLSKEIMNIVESKEEDISIAEKYKILESAPYGLNIPLIDLYFFISNKLGRTYIVNKATGRPLPLERENTKKLSSKAQDYEMKKNEIIYVPEKVVSVWKALGRITGIRSEAKKVKADSRNDFNVELTLSKEMEDIYKIISKKEIQLSSYGIKTGKLKTLSNKLNSIQKQRDNKQKFKELEELPYLFRNTTYEENIEELKSTILKYNKLKDNRIYFVKDILSNLDYKIENLEGYESFKSTLKDIKDSFENYKNDYLNLELLEDLGIKSEVLKENYYREFKKIHDNYYEEYESLKIKLEREEKGKIEAIKYFEDVKFGNVASIKPFLEELDSFEKCSCKEENGEMRCRCKINSLGKASTELKELEEKFSKKKAHISGIFQRYQSSLKDIQTSFQNNDDFFDLMINMRQIESGNYEHVDDLKEKIVSIKESLNNYLEDKKESFGKSIEIDKMRKELNENLMILGKKEITLNEFNDKIYQLLERYKNEGYEGIKIFCE